VIRYSANKKQIIAVKIIPAIIEIRCLLFVEGIDFFKNQLAKKVFIQTTKSTVNNKRKFSIS
jgi:hypothetical protein